MTNFNYFFTPVGPEYKKKFARNVGIALLILFAFYGIWMLSGDLSSEPKPELDAPTFDYEIKKDDVTYGSQYQILGGTVSEIQYDESSNSLIISLDESEEGYIKILIQIGLLHSLDQSPFTYFVLLDGEEVIFEQLSPIYLKIPFEKGTKQIEIIGTNEI